MEIKGDFLGFSFAGVRSESLGIVRTSDGDRYSEELQPEIRDITVEVPGMNGNYYFGSTYGPRELSISFAFDSMTEEQFRKMRATFGKGKIGNLIFDERPYKAYMAKIAAPIELDYICFDEQIKVVVGEEVGDERYGVRKVEETVSETIIDEETSEETTIERIERVPERIYPYETLPGTRRIYKGEGKIGFICYYPFAKSVFKVLPTSETYTNVDEWSASSGMLSNVDYTNYSIDIPTININDTIVQLYNPGDVETSCRIYFPFEAAHTIDVDEVPQYGYENILIEYWDTLLDNSNPQHCIQIKNLIRKGDDEGFMINTETGIIEGVQTMTYEIVSPTETNTIYVTSGNIYNEYMTSGHFFKIEPNIQPTSAFLRVTGGSDNIQVSYNYLYL